MHFYHRITLALAIICLFGHSGLGAPTTGRYTWVKCKPEDQNANCVTQMGPLVPLEGKSPQLPPSAVKDMPVEGLSIPTLVGLDYTDYTSGAELTQIIEFLFILHLAKTIYCHKGLLSLARDWNIWEFALNFHIAHLQEQKHILESFLMHARLVIGLTKAICGTQHVGELLKMNLFLKDNIYLHSCNYKKSVYSEHVIIVLYRYPEARAIQRKLIFHAGPTNSGKTYHAIQRYLAAKSGVYCGPLKLLAHEIYEKSNEAGVPCDLVTGEERIFVDPEGRQSDHIACTIEMCSVTTPYEVAVIDEIQMIRDPSRGWAWTRALLGLCAEEIHVCGETAAIDFITELMYTTGEEVEVHNYKRLTPFSISNQAVESLDNLKPGDCIVCFSKNDIYSISRQIEIRGLECAVIYGSLPPGTKLAQAKKFNDQEDPCKILVATDAIGMGLNLSIRRIIFNSLVKPNVNEKGEKEMDTISTSQALQIAGRAGRFSSVFKEGEVTTMQRDDLPVLKEIMGKPIEPIEVAGLHPTAEQIEMFAYHLPQATLSNLIDIFVSLSQVDGLYFVCNIDDFKFLADMIQHIPLNLRTRYVFCTAPINKKQPFVCTSFLKFARQFSRDEPLTFDWVCRQVNWPLIPPKNIKDLVHLEAVHDVLDLYLWLSYRFMDMFPDANHIREIQKELDTTIQIGVRNITRLIRATENQTSSTVPATATRLSGSHQPSLRRGRVSKAQNQREEDMATESSLGSKLVQDGLLTKELLHQLQREWIREQSQNEDSSISTNKVKGKRKKK
ncbi:ATP-dependent RNA helicase SUPV3L1, mitochondrial [Triplophysa tibetana]|uniref:ATP-dependent RNA helicase SUPV3L1, mitochondrial n=1 Tax=Triplophysa tibetana TaxID=1572043 RepID=A0A5A9P8B7_9TELE|nr:ATP-dependent RNA helicase SUPV3L1, mitochondrial [Triplophysa tibetana]